MKRIVMRSVFACIVAGITVFSTACGDKAPSSGTGAKSETSAVTSAPSEASTSAASSTASTYEGIASFDDINTDKVKLVALGNSDVPVGQYSQEIFEKLGFWDDIQSKISFGSNVKEVLSQVEQASVDCGVVYATDAATATGIKVVCNAPEGSLDTPVVYPAAILSKSENKDAAKVFFNYLLSQDALNEFEKVGFSIAADKTAEDMKYDGPECTLNVFAAASLTESLTAIQSIFNEKYPNIKLVYNFDSSGKLQKQIENGAEADIFFSAAQKQMNALNDENYVDKDTITNILENKVVLIVPEK